MRYIRYAIWVVLAIALVSMSLANREALTLVLLPGPVADFAGWNISVTLPVFVIVLAALSSGLLVGFFWEWLRETKHRRTASQKNREVRTLERQVVSLKTERDKDKDDVLALLDEAS